MLMTAKRSTFLLLNTVLGLGVLMAGCGPWLSAEGPFQGRDADEVCPTTGPDTQLLMNGAQGYCLLYPTGYDAVYPNESEIALVVGGLLDVEHPRAYIEVQKIEGHTAQQAADELVAQIPPEFNIERTDIVIDGEGAVMLDKLPGQDMHRQVMGVHAGRLYTLTFVPVGEDYGDIHTQMEALYAVVIDSFRFLP
jgi:hypothetical protein